MASTAKVPEPCTGTVTWLPCPPASATILASTILLMPRKLASREPQSWTMACLTLAEVVSGPGVSSSGSPVSDWASLVVMGRFMGSRCLCVQYIIHMPLIGLSYMTPTQLRAFHLVAESGSFSAAARASGLSQPNLSSQVTALEQAYGVRLFDRRGRSVAPTETGRQLHGVTTRLFAVQDEARALLAGEQALTRGHLRIAADSAHHVVPIMAALRDRTEGLTFALAIATSAVVLDRLLNHAADVAVMAKSVSDPRLHALRLRTDRVVLFVPAGHPLARRGRANLEALDGQELVLRERGSIT